MRTREVDHQGRCKQLAERMSRGGRFEVTFVHCPDRPEVAEYIARHEEGPCVRFINLDAQPGARITILIQ